MNIFNRRAFIAYLLDGVNTVPAKVLLILEKSKIDILGTLNYHFWQNYYQNYTFYY